MASINPVNPVVAKGQSLVFEVEVDSRNGGFSWVIADSGNKVQLHDYVPRDPNKNEPQEFSFAQTIDTVGRYQLRLFDGKTGATKGQRLPNNPLPLAEDSFVVLEPSQMPTTSANTGPFKVRLVAESGAGTTVDPAKFPTYDAFRAEVEAKHPTLTSDWYREFGSDSYDELIKLAKEFVRGFEFEEYKDIIPEGYLDDRLKQTLHKLPLFQGNPPKKVDGQFENRPLPGYELIWNYWQEEGMLVQTLNVILARFQNRRLPGRDPLARFDVTPLLPLRNRLWGFAEAEVHRLTVRRRAAEYQYEYGLSLLGRAVPRPVTNVERRSGFLESFHQVIHLAHIYYKEFDDLTVQADSFPLYRAIRDCHLVLSQGSHNQYGEMALQARAEFYVMQSILAEPQMREFLGGRPMTPYTEEWMDRVDTMKSIQGWPSASVMHFHDLATLGEQLVLSIRLGNWNDTIIDANVAGAWAQGFRSAIQKYAAAYRSVTGVDLARAADATMPSTLIARRASDGRLGA